MSKIYNRSRTSLDHSPERELAAAVVGNHAVVEDFFLLELCMHGLRFSRRDEVRDRKQASSFYTREQSGASRTFHRVTFPA